LLFLSAGAVSPVKCRSVENKINIFLTFYL
jgi:hypothetical protein